MTGDAERSVPGLDVAALAAEFTHQAAAGVRLPVGRPLTVSVIPGGLSNLTYLASDGVTDVIVRRGPLGHVLPTAHDMGREFRVLTALRDTPVPAPRPLYLWEQVAPMGAPYYVMERLPGVVLRREADLAGLAPGWGDRIAEGLVDALVGLHELDALALRVPGAERVAGFLARQVDRWGRQDQASRTRELPEADALAADLARGLPETREMGVLHGDYRLDNALIELGAPDGPRVSGLLDWEMSTVGDLLTDVAMLTLYWQGVSGLAVLPAPAAVAGFPPASALLARYAEKSGRELGGFGWYMGFAFYKLAVIAEGIHARYRLGVTVGEGFGAVGAVVPELLARGRACVAGEAWW